MTIRGYTPAGGPDFDSFITQTGNGTVVFSKVLSRRTLKVGSNRNYARGDLCEWLLCRFESD